MNQVTMQKTSKPTTLQGQPVPFSSAFQAAIDTVATDQDLDRSDLVELMAYLRAKEVKRQQLPGLLRQACSRLNRIRKNGSCNPAAELADGEVAVALTRAYDALKKGSKISLEEAGQSFAEALALCRKQKTRAPNIVASIGAEQAEVAALRQDHRQAADLYAKLAATPGLPLAAQWRFQHERAAVLEELGREYGDHEVLVEAVDLYENTVLPLVPRSERPDEWSATQHSLGNVLGIIGQHQRGIRLLQRSVAAFENALGERSREDSPLEWAVSQHGLGNALGILAQRQADTGMLENAVSAFESALQVRSREQSQHDWAMTQYDLGTALLTLGQLKRNTSVLTQSIQAYRQVLQVWTQERFSLDWARSQNSLGTALRVRGEQEGNPRELEQAVAAYRNALTLWTRELAPEQWAMTQNNLGAALQRLGERENETWFLAEAVAAYENALQELHREDMPIAWAMTTANMGDARRCLAQQARDAEISRRAVSDFEAVAEIFHDASHPQYYELAKEKLDAARKLATELDA